MWVLYSHVNAYIGRLAVSILYSVNLLASWRIFLSGAMRSKRAVHLLAFRGDDWRGRGKGVSAGQDPDILIPSIRESLHMLLDLLIPRAQDGLLLFTAIDRCKGSVISFAY